MGTYLDRTPSSAGNRRTFTISVWVKPTGGFGSSSRWIFGAGSGSGDNDYILMPSGNQLKFSFATEASGNVATNRLFRDPSAWYHIVIAVDTTQSTAADRVKMYVNGVQETSFGTASYPAQNYDTSINNTVTNRIGARAYSPTGYWNGYMADFYLIDGQQLAPTQFGETDSTTGIWKPKTYSGTFGTNGVHLQFKNSGALGTDTSGNSNTYAVNNAGTNAQVTDTPSNVFCIMNPLANYYPNSTFTLGGLAVAMGASQSTFNAGTFGVSSGKWYFEMKPTALGSGTDNCLVGIVSRPNSNGTSDYLGEPTSIVYRNNGQKKSNSANATYGASWTTSDIVMVAVDCDNNNVYFGTNGNWADGSGSNNQASPSSAIAFTSTMINDGVVFPAFGDLSTNAPEPAGQFNFGNPPFSISSGNADANGFGNFEYAVPSGYYALCTKNINTYG